MLNTFRHSRCSIITAIALAGMLSGCGDESSDSSSATPSGLAAPQNVQSPILSADEDSAVLVWEKPQSGAQDVVDYRIYRNGELLGSAGKTRTATLRRNPISTTSTRQ